MGYVFSIVFMVAFAFLKDTSLLTVAGLFAIAGSIEILATKFHNK